MTWKDFAIIVGACMHGVYTAIAMKFAMNLLRDHAILSARSDVQRIVLSAHQQSQTVEPQTVQPAFVPTTTIPIPSESPLPLSDESLGYTNIG